jgi:hypothetical protein
MTLPLLRGRGSRNALCRKSPSGSPANLLVRERLDEPRLGLTRQWPLLTVLPLPDVEEVV